MRVVTMPQSTAEESYFDSKLKEEIKAFFEGTTLEANDIVKYSKDYPFSLLRREAENHRFDIYYCPPGSPEFEEHGEYTLKVMDRKYLKETEPMRELLTEEHFEALAPGEKIYRVRGSGSRGLRVVGRMPGSNVYIILSDGEHLEYLYIPNNVQNSTYTNTRWFTGKYDSKKLGLVMLENIDKNRESIERIYIKDED